MITVGIDLSMRSTGLVALNDERKIISKMLIMPSAKEYNDEHLLFHVSENISRFLCKLVEKDEVRVVIEGLSLGSASGSKDILYGNYWMARCAVKSVEETIDIFSVPVTRWRKYIVNKDDRDRIKEEDLKDGLKIVAVEKLPENVKEELQLYVKVTPGAKPASLYDLTDAYWLFRA